MFATAKTVAPVKKSKSDKKDVRDIKGLEAVGLLDAAIKSLTAMKQTYEGVAKEAMSNVFVEVGMAAGKRPDNFKGIEGSVTASCELRMRSSKSGLSPDEVALCTDHGIPTTVVVDTHDTYILNPEHAHNAEYQAVMQKALEPLIKKGKLPADIFMKQEGVSRKVVADDAMDAVFAKDDEELVARLLAVVGTLAIKPKVDDAVHTKDLLAKVGQMMQDEDEEA